MALIHLLDGYTLRLKRTRYADRQQCRIRLDELSLFKGATPLEHLVGVEPERTSNLSYARLRLHRQLHNVSLLRYRSPPADLTPGAHLLGITHAQMIIPAASLRQRDTPYAYGNVTPAAEYNMWVDPEAARFVLASGLRTELIGWQLSRHDAVLGAGDIDTVLALGTPYAEFAVKANSAGASAYLHQTGERGISLPDPIAMAILLEPALCLEASDHYVAVEVASPLTRGMTVVDRLNVAHDARNRAVWRETLIGAKPSSICWRLDVRGWKAALLRALA